MAKDFTSDLRPSHLHKDPPVAQQSSGKQARFGNTFKNVADVVKRMSRAQTSADTSIEPKHKVVGMISSTYAGWGLDYKDDPKVISAMLKGAPNTLSRFTPTGSAIESALSSCRMEIEYRYAREGGSKHSGHKATFQIVSKVAEPTKFTIMDPGHSSEIPQYIYRQVVEMRKVKSDKSGEGIEIHIPTFMADTIKRRPDKECSLYFRLDPR